MSKNCYGYQLKDPGSLEILLLNLELRFTDTKIQGTWMHSRSSIDCCFPDVRQLADKLQTLTMFFLSVALSFFFIVCNIIFLE